MTAGAPTAVVMGAAGGIGSAVVLGLVEDGRTVIAVDHLSNRLDELAVTAEKCSGTVITVAGDVRHDLILKRAVRTAEELGQGIGMLIPAAVYTLAEPAGLSFDPWRQFLSIKTDADPRES